MSGPLGVGIIGANPKSGWAATAHVPALQALDAVELRAVSTTRQKSADAAAEAFGVAHAFDNYDDLVNCPEVGLVVITVKVPHHLELVTAALAAGKSVYCEWPLGATLGEAEQLNALADRSGRGTMIGLQARVAPVIAYTRAMLASDELGEILSTTIVGASRPGTTIAREHAYLADVSNGATLLTIGAGHSLDALCHCLGEFSELSALTAVRQPVLRFDGSTEALTKTAPDQVAVIGTLEHGATASVHFRESLSGHSTFLWEINGTRGTAQITAARSHPGIYPLTLTVSRGQSSDRVTIPVPADESLDAPTAAAVESLGVSPAANVARMYAQFVDDVTRPDRAHHTTMTPSFTDALTRHRTLAAIEWSALHGVRWQEGQDLR